MKITDYAFTNNNTEYQLIKELLLEVETYPEIDHNWEPGRMDWWRYNIHAEKGVDFFQVNAHYWKTETDQVVGLFISEYGKDDFFIVVHPHFWTLFSEVLHWGLAFWAQGKTKISTTVFTYGQPKIELLLAAGFYEDGHEENVRTYSLEQYDFSYNLKPGFRLLRFSDYGHYESRVKLVHNAFNNPAFSEARLRSIQSSPGYQADLDLVIVNSQGESVAYCMGWVAEHNPKSGYIEPMGVHTDYRRNGFGKALAKECFQRLHQIGVERAWIASNAEPDVANLLYESLKPTSIKRAYRYSLNLEE
ncbi:MAG: N-acetyltransferase [Chloroflexi bacterium AL-W]|nr:N-acetyltransferase [Chloroflexi bacterium AL-N1]NOK68375.1 N-acetyltransferase [Chloroflexi bacterium AL-N10]NOK74021.1 N-acetyltransferase [Chloroflexi bacterium AL-N5]NOK82989.1 N-acetyltransferase [Chloroflexi bacterium AL-W]NOK90511.1 N-acetyltransferase [Chloroflexi bacterium AL-N15]